MMSTANAATICLLISPNSRRRSRSTNPCRVGTRIFPKCHDFNDLPKTCQDYVKRLEELSGCRISVIGTGPQRDHVIQINSLVD